MPPSKTKPSDWLDLLIEKAPALREAGVLEIELDGCTVSLAPVAKEQEQWVPMPTTEEHSMGKHMDALDDPDTFDGKGTQGFYGARRQGPGSNDGMRVLDD